MSTWPRRSRPSTSTCTSSSLNEIDRSFRGAAEAVAQQVRSRILAGRNQSGGDGTGAAVRSVQARSEQVKDFYAELPITVRLTGTYHDFGAFAGDIGKLSRIVTLNNIAIVTTRRARMERW
jgi:type IV pilus assembly protein PilO